MSLRKILFWIHLTVGCAAGVVILIMSVTGVLLAYERQITNWVDRDVRSAPQSAGAVAMPMEKLLAGVVEQNHVSPSAVTLRSDPMAPVEVSVGREHVYLVDAYSGRILGERSPVARAFFQSVENWHRWLAGTGDRRVAGRAVTGACNFLFLLLVVSGPFLWMPRKWSWQSVKAVALFRSGLSGKARDFNWHNVIGIWCAVPLFLIVLSGVVMSYPWANNLLYRVMGSEPPVQDNAQRQRPPRADDAAPNFAGLDPLWARAVQQVPGWRSLTLRFSRRGPVTFTIDTGNGGRPDQRAQLTFDRCSGEIVKWEPFAAYNAGRRMRSWFRFMHTGEAGGLAGQTIAAAATSGAAMLVWTGLWLAWRRLLRWKKRRYTREASAVAVGAIPMSGKELSRR